MSILGRIRQHRENAAFAAADDEWLRTDAVRWEPLTWGVADTVTGPAADMNDPGQVFQKAYKVMFRTRAVRGARIIVCTYAVCTYAPETQPQAVFWKGLRYTYSLNGDGGAFCTGYEMDPEDQAYEGSVAADTAALGLAVLMARDPGWAAATMPGIFGWDGQRFDVTIHAAEDEL